MNKASVSEGSGSSGGRARFGPIALVAALLVALLGIVLVFILPAETGRDPTGLGARLGLTKIADPVNKELERGLARMARQDVLLLSNTAPPPQAGLADAWEWDLAPYEGIEFKYTMAEGAEMAFSWQATGPLHYDLHSHPFVGGAEQTESFAIGNAARLQGRYIAPFTGIHGWYWQNRTSASVRVRLEASGGITGSTIFGTGAPIERPLEGAGGAPAEAMAGQDGAPSSGP